MKHGPPKSLKLAPEIKIKVDTSDLELPDIEINLSALPEIEYKPVKSNSNSKSLF